MRKIEQLNFDNLAIKSLPIDPITENYTRTVQNSCFSLVEPEPLKNPILVSASLPALSLIDLEPAELDRPDFAEYFGGNKIIPGSRPAAHCYCGFQFGYFSGQLGDGATMYLGEIVNSKNERWEIQFKGAGKTPYSRDADGRKVLRSSLREYLCSEAMHHLGVPTTRAGTIVTSDSTVVRDMFYTGNAIREKCTVILRIAPTFLRFGSFEISNPVDKNTGRKGPNFGNTAIIAQLLNYAVDTFFPEIAKATDKIEERAIQFLTKVVDSTAYLVSEWQGVGFCHGVLNTDNMSIMGLTIDYGPFGFLEYFDKNNICNNSDSEGRYTYAKQPEICKWNCQQLAKALSPFAPLSKTSPITEFDQLYSAYHVEKFRKKLGLRNPLETDRDFIDDLIDVLQATHADFTLFFRSLHSISLDGKCAFEFLRCSRPVKNVERDQYTDWIEYVNDNSASIDELLLKSKSKYPPEALQKLLHILKHQPEMLLYYNISPESILGEVTKIEEAEKLKKANPSELRKKNEAILREWLNKYLARLKQEIPENATTEEIEKLNKEREELMIRTNPKYILRNYIAQKAIEQAENDDFTLANQVLELLSDPYGLKDLEDVHGFSGKPPSWALKLKVSCSS